MNILIYISIGVVVVYLIYRFLSRDIFDKKEVQPFYLKQRVMNDSEQALFINLNKQLGSEYLVLSKVRIEDFVGVNKNGLTRGDHFGLRNRIKSRHIDFLICESSTTKPILAIELDGGSHNNYERKIRDAKLNKVYSDINLKDVHIKVGNDFEEKAKEIINQIKKDRYRNL